MNDAEKSVAFFGRSVGDSLKGLKGKIGGALAGLTSGLFAKQGIEDAMRYEALMTTLGETMGKSRAQFEDWAKGTGRSMGFSMLQSAQLANTLSLNFKSISSSQQDLVNKTTKMMEAAAIIANKRGMTMEEVSDRIRSAMNQEADGADELGVNVRVAAIQQSEAYKKMADGKPWDQLSTNMQRTILYEHILESVTNNLGSTMQDTTAQRMAVFSASLADVRMALGQAFLPIIYTVLPYLTMFMNFIYKVLAVIAAFSKALFGGFKYQSQTAKGANAAAAATQKQAGAVGNLGKATDKTAKKQKKAAKAAKDSVAAFDEVNTLANDAADAADAGAGAGGAGGGAGGPAMPDMGGISALPSPDMSGFTEAVDKMVAYFQKKLQPIKDMAKTVWEYVSSFAQVQFYRIVGFWNKYGDQIMKAMSNLWNAIKPIIMFLVKFIWDSVKGLVKGVITFFEGITEFFTGVFTGDWKLAWKGLVDIFFGAIQAIWNFTNLTLVGGLRKLFVSIAMDGAKIFLGLGKNMTSILGASFGDIVKWAVNLIKNLKAYFAGFGSWWDAFAVTTAHKVVSAWEAIGKVGTKIWSAIKSAFFGAVTWFTRSVIAPMQNGLENVKNAFKSGIVSGLKGVLNSIRGPLNALIGGANSFKNALHLPLKDIRPIPQLATGGIATGPTLALVGEGRQDEAIAPIDKLQGYIANAVLAAMRVSAPTGGKGGDIILNIDGRTFARVVQPYLQKEAKRVGTNVRLNPI